MSPIFFNFWLVKHKVPWYLVTRHLLSHSEHRPCQSSECSSQSIAIVHLNTHCSIKSHGWMQGLWRKVLKNENDVLYLNVVLSPVLPVCSSPLWCWSTSWGGRQSRSGGLRTGWWRGWWGWGWSRVTWRGRGEEESHHCGSVWCAVAWYWFSSHGP